MADGEPIYGEFDYVEDLEYFEGLDEPVDLIKEIWTLSSTETMQYVPPGWEPPEEDEK